MNREWSIVSTALQEGRHELVVSGKEFCQLIEKSGLDQRIYHLKKLNFLEISHTCLESLSEDISKLSSLAQLCLTTNMLKSIPVGLGCLHSLRSLDLSFNKLTEIPDIFHSLSSLSCLILSGNEIQSMPSVKGLTSLHEFLASKNKLSLLPDGIDSLTSLTVLDVSYNQITTLPKDICNLSSLKNANFAENSLTDFPANIHRCRKLNQLKIHGNPFKDNRLKRLSVDDHSPTALLAYLRRLDESGGGGGGKAKKAHDKQPPAASKVSSNGSDNTDATSPQPEEPAENLIAHLVIQRPSEEEQYQINQMHSVKSGPRPFIVACTIHGVNFSSEGKLKAFLRAQEDWHRDIGQMRRQATLATHDLREVVFPLTYSLEEAQSFEIHPLNRANVCTGEAFLKQLVHEAQMDRKSRKQAKFSQIYRYLNVLNIEGAMAANIFSKVMVPVVVDKKLTVISVPPLTNSHSTRLKVDTRDILIEVTGVNLSLCQKFAELVIAWLLENTCSQTVQATVGSAGGGGDQTAENATSQQSQLVNEVNSKLTVNNTVIIPTNSLVVRPIRVVGINADSNLSFIFPSRTDLTDPKFHTIR
ncbi:unnamed protein product [Trichobilharzia szidati]|nr:unnamed protein product [Trichobilharzia szidati]